MSLENRPTDQPETTPPSSAPLPDLDEVAARLIRLKARRLVGKAGFTRSDQDDLEQELTLKLLKHRAAFDPRQSHWHAFVTAVVERHAATLLRNKQVEKRDHKRVTSLHVVVEDPLNGPGALADTIGRRERDARLGLSSRSDIELLDLRHDVAAVLESLPPRWREVCERLKHDSISQVARDLGVPRTTLSYLVRRLRKHFETAGLKDYL